MQADIVTTYPGVTDPRDQLVSPMFGEHTCATPLHHLAGSREIVGSDAIRVAARARQDYCEVTLILLEEMWLEPIADGIGSPELRFACHEMISFVRQKLVV